MHRGNLDGPTTCEAVAEVDCALTAVQDAKDTPGEARAQAERDELVETLQKPAGALVAGEAAAAAWRTAGDGPGEAEALCRQALLLRNPAAVDARLTEAITRTQRLCAGLPKDKAMGRAMSVLAKTKEWGNPFVWAPFLVTRDPGGNEGVGTREE